MKPSVKKPSEAVKAWMPDYIGDCLRETAHFNTQEMGALWCLRMAYWIAQTPLPDNDARLANITRASTEQWALIRPTLEPLFIIGDGVWRHEQLDAEIIKALRNFETQQNRTKAATEARKGNRDGQRDVGRDDERSDHTRADEGEGEGPYRKKGSEGTAVGTTDPSWEVAA